MAARTTPPLPLDAQRDDAIRRDIGPRLIAFLRETLRDPALDYAEPPAPVSGGFDTSIFAFRLAGAPDAFSYPLIVRVCRGERGSGQAAFETAVQQAVAALGYPAPPVLLSHLDARTVGGAFTIMPRVPGRVMLDALLGPAILRLPALLGRTHAALHRLDAGAFRALLRAAGHDADEARRSPDVAAMQARARRASLTGLEAGMEWLAAHRPRPPEHPVICHGDFHPLNILVDARAREVTGVIDWPGALIADAACDVGSTVALITQGPVDVPPALYPLIGLLRRRVVAAYLRAYRRELPLDLAAVRYYEALRCMMFLLEAGEQIQAAAGIIDDERYRDPFEEPHVQRSISKRLRQLTGTRVAVP